MNFKCTLVEKESKAGKKYVCLEVSITDSYSKVVFLDESELELIKIISNVKKQNQ